MCWSNGRSVIEVLSTDSAVAPWAGSLGALFAALSAVANLAVIAVHALDGSVAMAELERAGLLLHRYEQLVGEQTPPAVQVPTTEQVPPIERLLS